MLEDNSI